MARVNIEALWIEVEDHSSSSDFQKYPETDTRSDQVRKDDLLLAEVNLYARELENQGFSPEAISLQVIERLEKVVPHLTIERNSYPPYDVSVKRGIGWGTVIYVDYQNRLGISKPDENHDEESWG